MPRWASEEEQRKIVELYNHGEGLTCTELARMFFYGRTTIRNILQANGVEVKQRRGVRPSRNMERAKYLRELYQDGMSLREIGDQEGMSYKTVRDYILHAGGKLRDNRAGFDISLLRGKTRLSCYRAICDALESSDRPMTTREVFESHGVNLSDRRNTARALHRLQALGLVECVTKAGRSFVWQRTKKDIREIFAELDPQGNFIDSVKHRLPARPLLLLVDELLARKTQELTYSGISYQGTPGESGVGPLEMVCNKLEISTRGVNRWRRGEALKTDFDTADKLITNSPYWWQEVYNEATVRLPEFTIQVLHCFPAEDKKGNSYLACRTYRQFPIGDTGTDHEALEAVRQAFAAKAEDLELLVA